MVPPCHLKMLWTEVNPQPYDQGLSTKSYCWKASFIQDVSRFMHCTNLVGTKQPKSITETIQIVYIISQHQWIYKFSDTYNYKMNTLNGGKKVLTG